MNIQSWARTALCDAVRRGSALMVSAALASTSVMAEGEMNDAIEEVLVTGLKVERSLQDTPVSISLTTAEDMEVQGMVDLYDVLSRTANVSAEPSNSFSIRGIDAFNVSTTGHSGSNSGLISVFVDGASLPYRQVKLGGLGIWDVKQVEVLRGPQSTLQGRNTLAGAVVVTTQEPSYEWGADVKVVAGENGQNEIGFAAGGAIIDDQLAIRVTGESREFDGHNKNITNGDNADFIDNDSVTVKALFEPEALPGFKALLKVSRSDNDSGAPIVNIPTAGQSAESQRTLDFDVSPVEYTETDLYSLRLSYEFNDHWTLDSITTYTDATYGYVWDGDASPTPGLEQLDRRDDETKSQELRLVFNYETVSGVIGAYYSDLESQDVAGGGRLLPLASLGVTEANLMAGFGLDAPTAALVMSLYGPVDPVVLGINSDTSQNISSTALFADVTWRFAEQWDLMIGARYDQETQEFASSSLYTVDNASDLPDPLAVAGIYGATAGLLVGGLNSQLLGQAASASSAVPLSDESYNELLPKLGLTYHLSDDMSVSATYQEAYRSGGISYNIQRGYAKKYDAEYTENYELSLRSVWLEGDLTVNANLFYLDWQDQQISVNLGGGQYDTEVINAGSSKVKGFELSADYTVNSYWNFYGSLGFAKSEFTDYVTTQGSFDGRPFTDSPEWTGALGATYRADNGVFANVNAVYTDDSIAQLTPNGSNGEELKNESHTLVNIRAGYEWRSDLDWGIYVNVQNLFDEEYVAYAEKGGIGTHTLSSPRQASLELRASF